jgi:hypothetical protein
LNDIIEVLECVLIFPWLKIHPNYPCSAKVDGIAKTGAKIPLPITHYPLPPFTIVQHQFDHYTFFKFIFNPSFEVLAKLQNLGNWDLRKVFLEKRLL